MEFRRLHILAVCCCLMSLLPLSTLAYPSHDTSWPNPPEYPTETTGIDPSATANDAASVTTHRRLPLALYTHLAIANAHNGSPTNSDSLSNGAKAGIGIGVSLFVVLVLTILLIQRHKKRERERLRMRYRSMQNWAAAQAETARHQYPGSLLYSPGIEHWSDKEGDTRRSGDQRSPTQDNSATTTAGSGPASAGKREPNAGQETRPEVSEVPKAHVKDSGPVI